MSDNYRVKIDPSTGGFEVEGPETFVREMLEKYAAQPTVPPAARRAPTRGSRQPKKRKQEDKASEPGKAGRSGSRSTPEADTALAQDLRDNLEDLKGVFAARRRLSHPEEAAVIAWFLDSKLERKTLNASSYYTSLRVLNRGLPKAAHQVLIDAKNRRNFFNEGADGFVLAPPGINFAERDSLKQEGEDKSKK